MDDRDELAELRARPPRPLMTRAEAELLRLKTSPHGAMRHCVDSYLALLDQRDVIPNPETERAA